MGMYFLYFTAEPTTDSPEYGKIQPGYAHVWVQANSPEIAEFIAEGYMAREKLKPLTLEFVVDSRDMRLDDLGAAEASLYHRALKNGVALDFVSSLVDDSAEMTGFRHLNYPEEWT